MSDIVELENSEVFENLAEDLVQRVRALARVEKFPAGTIIFREDEPATNLYLLRSGEVELVFTDPGRPGECEFRITRIKPGQVFAWTTLSGSARLTAQANAVEDCEAILLPGLELQALMSKECQLGYAVMQRLLRVVAGRLRDTRTQLRWLLGSL